MFFWGFKKDQGLYVDDFGFEGVQSSLRDFHATWHSFQLEVHTATLGSSLRE